MTKEEAINKVREMNLPKETKEILEALAPELRESEDERIRVRLIEYFKGFLEGYEDCYKDGGCVKWEGLDVKRILAWLEKQKETANSFTNDVIEVRSFQRGMEEGRRLERQKEQKPEHFELKAGKWYICHRAFCCRADHLTVKEGERFMCEKDGIVKGFVIKEPEKYFKECSAPAPMEDEQKEQKPVVTLGETYHVDTLGTQQVIAGKMPQKPAEWDDYTKTNLSRAIQIIKDARGTLYGYQTDDGIYECDKAIEALEHFLYRGLEIEKSAEWSEEDESFLDSIEEAIHSYYDLNHAPQYDYWLEEKLKSLRPVSKEFLQPHWKPSEEHFQGLRRAILKADTGSDAERTLKDIYEQLKKL